MNNKQGSIEALLDDVGARLPGPADVRDDILAELADGLLEAVEANQRAGLERDRAFRAALREFGPPEPLAAAFRADLMVVRGRRTALALLAVCPIVIALWLGAARSRDASRTVRLFDSPIDHVAAATLVIAVIALGVWTLVTTGRATRWIGLRPMLSLLGASTMGALMIVGDCAALSVLAARLADFRGAIHTLLLAAAISASCASALLAGRASWTCLTLSRTRHRQ